jgi:tetratricopeptide (TPR) repeat protein
MRKKTVSPYQDEQREELMRPSRFLGYDRDSLGMYAMTKEMFGVAESQFRRSVYLNPYEPGFKQHLAWCLYKQGALEEAGEWIEKALAQRPDDDSRVILSKIHERMMERRHEATGGANAKEGI